MTTTLSQSQADLPRLVQLASQGEDVEDRYDQIWLRQ